MHEFQMRVIIIFILVFSANARVAANCIAGPFTEGGGSWQERRLSLIQIAPQKCRR